MKTLLALVLSGYCSVTLFAQEYSYDQAGRITSAKYSNGLQISYTYDANGNILSKKSIVVSSVQEKVVHVTPLQVYPNPTQGNVKINVPNSALGKNVRVNVMSVVGRVVLTTEFSANAFTGDIQMQNVESGVYNIRVITDSEEYSGWCFVL